MQTLQLLLHKIELVKPSDPGQISKLAKELLTRSRKNGAAKFQVKALKHLAICAKTMGGLTDAEEYIREAVDIADSHNLQRELLLSINILAGIIFLQGRHTQALELLEQYIQQASQPGFELEQARFVNNLGEVNELLGNYPSALKYYLKNVDLLRNQSDSRGLALTLHNMAKIYLRLEMYPESITNNQEALVLLEETEDLCGQVSVLNDLGELAYLQGNLPEAEVFHNRAIKLAREIGSYHELADSLVQRVKCWNIPDTENSAKNMLDEALQLCLTSGDKLIQADIMLQYGYLYLAQANISKALDASREAVNLSEFSESNERLCKAYKLFSEISQKSGNLADAFQYLSLYTELREELKGVQVSQKIQAITLPFELREAQAEAELLRLRNQELEDLTKYDHLTGLANRRFLQHKMELLWQQGSLSVIILDIDYFKQINDQFSHSVGDLVLKKCGEILNHHCPEEGLAARFGGEEFVLLIPLMTLDEAVKVAEKIRLLFENYSWDKIAESLIVTISSGVAHSSEDSTVETVLQLADSRLYHAKRTGRNKVVPAVVRYVET